MADAREPLLGSAQPNIKAYGAYGAESESAGSSSIAFSDISYVVKQGWSLITKSPSKVVLNLASGIFFPGVNAILGPTGSGKTTLLDILADRKAKAGLSGHVLVNGSPKPSNFKCSVGYVVQEDCLTGTLTVRENLAFSAALRLPSVTSARERKEKVDSVLKELGLQGCADQKIGTDLIRGVSGGERKRTSIGMELIIEPQVLFLDEPTTGLDANTAVSVVKLLRRLCEGGNRIVIMSIHQPRYSIYKLFDTITLMSLGNIVYHGTAGETALQYFSGLGYGCEIHDNPSDHFLDIITTCEEASKTSACVNLSDKFKETAEFNSIDAQLKSMVLRVQEVETSTERTTRKTGFYATSPFWQIAVLVSRALLKMWRNPMTSVAQLIVMVVFSLIVGGIYYQLDNSQLGIQNRFGAIFFIIMSQVFGNLGAIEIFIQERALFLHENSGGYYRVSAFFIAKVMTDLVPLRMIPLLPFSAITYFMIGFQTSAEHFFIFVLTLCLTSIGGTAMAFACSALVSVFAVANLLVSLIYVFSMLFGGFLLALASIPAWVRWMKYLSLFRYSVEALAINELKGQLFYNTLSNGTCIAEPCILNGTTVLSSSGYEVDWLWWDQVALAAIITVLLAVTYLILLIIPKQK
ncbi:hypothetical protein EMCRGX_G019448 [Ephydatia muelleri]